MVKHRFSVPFTLEEAQERYTYGPIKGELWTKRHKHAHHFLPHLVNPRHGTAINYCVVRTHQLAWFMHYGVWPDFIIDHEDGDEGNIKIDNLRRATNQENCRNSVRENSNGMKGISFCRDRKAKPWLAQIRDDTGRKRNLGRFATSEEASRAYQTAARQYHGDFANYEVRDPLVERGDI